MSKVKLKTGPKTRKHRAPLPRKQAESTGKLYKMLRQGMKGTGKAC